MQRKFVLIESKDKTNLSLTRYINKSKVETAIVDYSDSSITSQSMKDVIEDFRVNGIEDVPSVS